ncbi:MAG: DUF2497 domain-containing protein [Acetobacteraceae bacterium]|nr:DUF2497 domain-containing protein [Pseudomonadota bacterium]
MTEPTKANGHDSADPSMEEILASIRRILNDDEAPPAAAPAPASNSEAAAEADEDVLVLDRSMLVSTPEDAAEEQPPVVEPPPATNGVAPDAIGLEPSPSTAESDAGPTPDTGLLAPAAAAAAASSVDGLLRTLAASRATQVYRGGPTLEDLVREEIRPLLKEWLDSHLPDLVERLVRAEIERVVGRAVS